MAAVSTTGARGRRLNPPAARRKRAGDGANRDASELEFA